MSNLKSIALTVLGISVLAFNAQTFTGLHSVGTVTETGTETAVFWQNRTEAKPRF